MRMRYRAQRIVPTDCLSYRCVRCMHVLGNARIARPSTKSGERPSGRARRSASEWLERQFGPPKGEHHRRAEADADACDLVRGRAKGRPVDVQAGRRSRSRLHPRSGARAHSPRKRASSVKDWVSAFAGTCGRQGTAPPGPCLDGAFCRVSVAIDHLQIGQAPERQQRRPVHVAMLAPDPEQRHAMIDFRGLPQPRAGLGAAPLPAAGGSAWRNRSAHSTAATPPRRRCATWHSCSARDPTGPRASRADRPAARRRSKSPARARKPSRERARAARGSSPADRFLRPSFSRQVQPSGVPLRRASARASRSARSGCARQYPSTASRGIGGVQRRLSA